MKKFFTTTAFLFLFAHLLCAQNSSKMSYQIYSTYTNVMAYENKLKALGQEPEGVFTTTVFIRCDAHQAASYFKSLGGVVQGVTKSVVRGTIDITKLDELAAQNFVYNIEEGNVPMEAYADTAYAHQNINSTMVYQGAGALSQGYTGTGALVGIIDTGVDYKHPDFRNADGTTRLLEYWDLNCVSSCTPPVGYTTGSLYTQQDINDAITSGTSTITNDEFGHGTCIAGLAAGNGNATQNKEFAGVAYKATILAVDLTPYYYTSDIIAGIEYMIRRSNELQKPIAINVSFGSSFGPHDGTDVYSTMVDEMLEGETGKGKAVVFAAGNDGDSYLHLRHESASAAQERHTWFQKATTMSDIYFQMYANNGEFDDMLYKLDVDVRNAAGSYEQKSVGSLYKNLKNLPVTSNDTIRNAAGQIIGTAFLYSYQYNATTTHISFSIRPAAGYGNAMWRFSTQGAGTIDMWNRDVKRMIYNNDSIAASSIAANYNKPDNEMSIAGGFNCSRLGITVGAFTNTNGFQFQSSYRSGTRGARYLYSSYGNTRDERIKPEIMAPGHIVIGPQRTYSAANGLTTIGGTHRYAAGTSYAAPLVTGALALYLETNPDATQTEIHTHIRNSAKTDSFTGTGTAIPNSSWGYGKLDVYELMKEGESTWRALSIDLIKFTATKDPKSTTPRTNLMWQTASETNNEKFEIQHSTDGKNYVTIDEITGNGTTTELHTYTATHTKPELGKNYYRLVDIEFSGKKRISTVQIVYFGNDVRNQPIETLIYPNPATMQSSLNVNIQYCQEKANMSITNIYGSIVYTTVLNNGLQQIQPNLNQGVYFVQIHDTFDETNKRIQKLVIE